MVLELGLFKLGMFNLYNHPYFIVKKTEAQRG